MMKENKINSKLKWCFSLSILAIIISVTSCIIIYSYLCSFYSYLNSGIIKDQIVVAKFESINTRFSDLYIWFGFFITILAGVLVLNWINAKNVAKKQAEEELKEIKDKFKNEFDTIIKRKIEIETSLQDSQNLLSTLKEEIKTILKKQ